ncbi:GGDEF domain-containing protein [Vibrio sp. TH_r3]|nr:GGDEF domain-containing protein [Vibrio sp. TH_r3]MDV7104831.1 GGDEF domain-containing protein [Vibrio sp. TH_r3]
MHIFAILLPTHHTIFSHSAVIIMISFFILGQKRGMLVALFLTVVSLSIFIYKYSSGVDALSPAGQGNIFILILITFIISYFNESTRLEYESALLRKNLELELLSKTDGLTQLFNRRYFDQVLDKEWKRLQQNNLELSIILCDIDHFKQFNDVGGHLAGDVCIQKIATTLKKLVKHDLNIVARYGGEEFIILLPEVNTEDAACIAQKILNKTRALALHHPAYQDKLVTVSLGLSTVKPTQQQSPSSIIFLADEALYESKNNGRNQMTVKNILSSKETALILENRSR